MNTLSPLEARFAQTIATYCPELPAPEVQFAFALAPAPAYGWAGGRRWRFDAAWPAQRVAAEIDGIYSAKSRHRTASGFHEDCNKFNAAAQLGWRVLRFTSRHLASEEGCRAACEQVRQILSRSVQGGAASTAKWMA